MLQLVWKVLVVSVLCGSCEALIERLYCGKHDCYECKNILGISLKHESCIPTLIH